MKNIMKYIGACLLSLTFFMTAKAQDTTKQSSKPDDIVCVQISENVFDCYMKKDLDEKNTNGNVNDGKFHEGSPGKQDPSLKKNEEEQKYSPEDSIRGKTEDPVIKAEFLH